MTHLFRLRLFSRCNIDNEFLKSDPISWESSASVINGKQIINSLKINTAERGVKPMEEYIINIERGLKTIYNKMYART